MTCQVLKIIVQPLHPSGFKNLQYRMIVEIYKVGHYTFIYVRLD